MRRTTWIAVSAVVLLLVASSGLSRSAWQKWSALPTRAFTMVSSLDWHSVLPAWLTERDASLAHLPWLWIVNGLVSLAGVIVAVRLLRPARPNPHRTVQRLARGGSTLPGIARRSRLSQDAVRTLLVETEHRRVPTVAVSEDEYVPSGVDQGSTPLRRKILPLGRLHRREVPEERPELVEGMSLVR